MSGMGLDYVQQGDGRVFFPEGGARANVYTNTCSCGRAACEHLRLARNLIIPGAPLPNGEVDDLRAQLLQGHITARCALPASVRALAC